MKTAHIALLGIVLVILMISGIDTTDRLTWVMEVLPVVIANTGFGNHLPIISAH